MQTFGPNGGRLIVNGPGVAIPLQVPPDRPADFYPDRNTDGHGAPNDKGPHGEQGLGDKMWGEGMQWCFGGYYPFGRGHCLCLSASFDLDFYARSFIPESHRNSISILDTNGNFILRLGSYGNQDDRGPEIRMAHCRFVAVNDTKLFINDVVNKRILSIDLKYEKEALAPLN